MTYIVSDIHGEYDLFMRLLEKLNFSEGDVLYVCGDIIEKGKHSIKLARYISRMPNARCIAGNHEYAFLKYYWALMEQSPEDFDGVLETLKKYFPDDGGLLDWELVDWFESLPYYIEEEDFICVHAGVPLDAGHHILPLGQATPEQLVYDRNFKEPDVVVEGGKCVFYGHTPASSVVSGGDRILTYLRAGAVGDKVTDYYKVHLDLGSWISGMVGAFCVETCKTVYVGGDTEQEAAGRIYISGDTHGTIDLGKLFRLARSEKLTYRDYVIICGDCGVVWRPDVDAETREVYEELKTNILFLDGNHENHAALNAMPTEEWHGGLVHRISEHILHLTRGQIFEIEGLTFFCLGGADSHDKEYRKPNVSWWREERITEADVQTAERNLEKVGYQVDFVLTHIPPNRFIERIIGELTQCGEEVPEYLLDKLTRTPSGERLQEIAPKLRFQKWFSGHLHLDIEIGRSVSLYEQIVRVL